MANVLTNLAADIYKAADTVGRELVGAIPSITINSGTEGVAVGQSVRSHFTRSVSTTSLTPSMTIPEGTDQTVDNKTLTISKQKGVLIPWTGEDIAYVNGGAGFETVYGDQIAQAMRALVNEAEADVCLDAYKGASRNYGTAGTNPFASNHDAMAEIRQILVDNGMPNDNAASLIINTAAGTKMRNLAQLQKANEAGGTNLLRQGTLLDLQNLMIKESAQVASHTAGTGASYQLNGALAVGDTTVAVDTGSGTILAGDVVTISNHKYVVATALSGGSFTINAPGIREVVADNTAITVAATRRANFALHKSAMEIVFRAPALPPGGDAAVDRMTIQDPFSGLVFTVSAYKGYKKAMFEVAAVWGQKVWKSDFIAGLSG